MPESNNVVYEAVDPYGRKVTCSKEEYEAWKHALKEAETINDEDLQAESKMYDRLTSKK